MQQCFTHVPTLFPPAQVQAAADALQASDEDGWTYRVRHDPTGRGQSLIDVYDENDDFIGTY